MTRNASWLVRGSVVDGNAVGIEAQFPHFHKGCTNSPLLDHWIADVDISMGLDDEPSE